MEFILVPVLIVAVIAFVAYPLFNRPREETGPAGNELDGLISQRDSAYDAIRDLDFDYQLGKLSQTDYESLRDKYKLRAAAALQQIDQLAGSTANSQIEEEIKRLRARHTSDRGHRSGAGDAIEQEIAHLRRRSTGRASEAGLEGAVAALRANRSKAKPTPTRCRQCGASAQKGDQFCSKCGAQL